MAKVKKQEQVDIKELNKFLDEFALSSQERSADGALSTPRYKTGIIMLDMLLNGGFPKGKAISIGAEPGVGKTTMLIQAAANIATDYNKRVYYIDVEGGATYELWDTMGYSHLLYNKDENPDGNIYLLDKAKTIQAIARIVKKVTQDPDTALIVIDSDTMVTDENAIEADDLGTGKNAVGSNARLWSAASKPMAAVLGQSEASMVIVHQARLNISGWMPVIEASGGNAVKHLVSVEIWGKKKAWIGEGNILIKDRSKAVGAVVSLTTKKNRLTKPFAAVTLPVFFGRGISNKWAYKTWLETHHMEDTTTGELIEYIAQGKSGYGTVNLPSGTYKYRGDGELWKLIDAYYDEIVSIVESNGGFELEQADTDNTEE